MTRADPRHIGIGRLPSTRIVRFAFLAAVLLLLVLKYRLLSLININWDEFRFLSRIYEFERGELGSAFQTFHVELFRWLARVPGNEADQVIAGRTFAFALRLASSYLIFLIGKRLFGITGALFAVLASLGFSHLMRHGEAFRADPIIACLFLTTASLLILRMSSPSAVALSAVALATAGLVSIKSALYLPSVALIFAAHLTAPGRGLVLRQFGMFCAVGLAAYLGLQTLHAAALPATGIDAAPAAAALAARIGRSVLGEAPFYDALAETVRLDLGFWVILMVGGAIALTEALRGAGEARRHGIILLGFLLPLGALFFYRNTFAYFYATVIPAAALVSGVVPARVERWLRRRPILAGPVLIGLGIPLALTGWRCYTLLNVDTVAPQRRVLEAVWEVFPERCSVHRPLLHGGGVSEGRPLHEHVRALGLSGSGRVDHAGTRAGTPAGVRSGQRRRPPARGAVGSDREVAPPIIAAGFRVSQGPLRPSLGAAVGRRSRSCGRSRRRG